MTLLLLAGILWGPQDPQIAPEIQTALDATAFHYKLSPNGLNFSLLFDHPNNRQQTVYVSGKPANWNDAKTHFVYTTVWAGDAEPTEEILHKILLKPKKLGYFYVFKDSKGKYAVRYGVHFEAVGMTTEVKADDPLVTTLKDMIYFVNAVGEETDIEVNGDKDIR